MAAKIWGFTVVQVWLTPWVDCTVEPSAKVNCHPWVIVHFALGISVFKNIINSDIHIHTPGTYSRFLYFKQNNYMIKQSQTINVINVQIH